jgi:hypothetical protein
MIAGLLLPLGLAGCVQNQTQSNAPAANTTVSNVPANTNTNQAPAESEVASSNVPITMPVVDALLSDEAFLSDVQRSVQPSDEQLDKLKTAARDAVLKLGEDDIQEGRSTRASLSEADRQMQ